ncbi:MAG: nucleotide exchange factor GrpE [Candidatus Cloacimonetes bacterium]|nr:nucleotide exchange factor GrpE [Candidatus Cloacimonadota bacterium]MCF7814064.1 nucleotide exchange factor GrpE [Candidatus Cloacimonadota bacterium]MCF7868634.1 nucleotide exchange factor GrpE [Candidatus Cloacimonadota bacterium]MCF7884089.1 nucleotide exchange factor GrpE [Candidatus Cloacimonadota bacterium]
MTDKFKEQETKKNSEVSKEKETKKKAKKLSSNDKIKALELELEEFKDRYVRKAAEFDNFRRRNISEKADWIKNANERIVLELCDVLDNFERALHPEVEKNRESLEKGIELIFQQLSNLLKKEGVEKIDAMEQEFDPNIHEALAHIPSEHDDNIVAAVIQNGYKMNNKVIRPARVAVSNGQKPEAEEENKKKKNK